MFSFTLDIYCTSVRPGRGIPHMWLSLRFLLSFYLLKGFFSSFSLLLLRVKGRGCHTLLKPYETNCGLWIWAIQIKFDLIDSLKYIRCDLPVKSKVTDCLTYMKCVYECACVCVCVCVCFCVSLTQWKKCLLPRAAQGRQRDTRQSAAWSPTCPHGWRACPSRFCLGKKKG